MVVVNDGTGGGMVVMPLLVILCWSPKSQFLVCEQLHLDFLFQYAIAYGVYNGIFSLK